VNISVGNFLLNQISSMLFSGVNAWLRDRYGRKFTHGLQFDDALTGFMWTFGQGIGKSSRRNMFPFHRGHVRIGVAKSNIASTSTSTEVKVVSLALVKITVLTRKSKYCVKQPSSRTLETPSPETSDSDRYTAVHSSYGPTQGNIKRIHGAICVRPRRG
jgi:hypothetical protein